MDLLIMKFYPSFIISATLGPHIIQVRCS